MTGLQRYDWARLHHLQLGRYAEYVVKMEFTLYGFGVYTPEVDSEGIDFVIRQRAPVRYHDVQVKSVRLKSTASYVFMPKHNFELRDTLLLALVIFRQLREPDLFLIPATAWLAPNSVFVDRNYEGLMSKPEWGLNIPRAESVLSGYRFNVTVERLLAAREPGSSE